jgi:quinoprotein glucose dehydrogenase
VGTVPALAARGIRNTGNAQRLHRNGPAVTAGGLIFIGSAADRTFHAYDKDNGKILWESSIEANPEGLVSTFEVNGRQYVAFCASGTADDGNQAGGNAAWLPGKLSAQGYYVYALPKGNAK